MNLIEQLFRLQGIDRRLKDLEQAQLDQTNLRRLVEMKKQEQAHGVRLEQMEWRLNGFKHRVKQGVDETASLQQQIEDYQKRLYDGTIRGSKELEHMEHKMSSLYTLKDQLEQELLEVMQDIEILETELHGISAEHALIQNQCIELERELKEYRQGLRIEEKRLHAARNREVAAIPAEWYQLYLKVYGQHDGIAVVRVKENRCTGCQVRISTELLNKVRNTDEPVHCEICGRILFYPEVDEERRKRLH